MAFLVWVALVLAGELVPGHWCSPTAAPGTAAGRTNTVFSVARCGHPSRPSPLTPPVALAVLLCAQSRPVPCAASPLTQCLKALGQANAYLRLGQPRPALQFIAAPTLILSNSFLFK